MTLADAPIQICCTFIYTLITYLMTAQPLELYRIGLFFGMCLMVAFVAQGLGLVVGSLFDVKVITFNAICIKIKLFIYTFTCFRMERSGARFLFVLS